MALVDDDLREALVRQASERLEGAGYYFDRCGTVATKLGEMLLEAESEAFLLRAARLRGASNTTPLNSRISPCAGRTERQTGGRSKTLKEVIAIYKGDVARTDIVEKTCAEDRRTFALQTESLGGDIPIPDIKRPQCTAFKELIGSLPKNAQ